MSAPEVLRPLLRTRQIRDFTDEPIADDVLAALADVARWTGSSSNNQPWRFIVLRDVAVLRRLGEAGMRQTLPLRTATAAIVIVLPDDQSRTIIDAYDDGRVAERLMVASTLLDLGAAITFIRPDVRPAVADLLGLPADRFVRTIVAFGHPSEAGRRPKSAPGTARLPRAQTVFEDRWPES